MAVVYGSSVVLGHDANDSTYEPTVASTSAVRSRYATAALAESTVLPNSVMTPEKSVVSNAVPKENAAFAGFVVDNAAPGLG